MAIYDNDGTMNYETMRVYDNDGDMNHITGKVYDSDGFLNYPVFSDETVLLDGTAGADLWELNLTAGSASAVLAINGGIYAAQTGSGSDDILKGCATTKDFYDLSEVDSITCHVTEYGTKASWCRLELVDANGTVTTLESIFFVNHRESAKETEYKETFLLDGYTGSYKIQFYFQMEAYYDVTRTTVTKCILD
ncbi:MAG: hypothetical protein IJN69_01370 [Oscillospiraceae bacterium]|nr:hypothetical protein [Oscillospiraceae bacterium]